MSFDAWGQRRNATDWTAITPPSLLATFDHSRTNKGFTGHEMLDEVGIIHMGGRIYDPKLGRFLQADPTVQFPNNTQSYNRYSYALNNPLGFTDSTRYSLLSSLYDVFWQVVPAVMNTVVAVTAYFACGGATNPASGAACAGSAMAGMTKMEGGTWNQALKAGAIAGASAFAFGQWGKDVSGLDGLFVDGGIGGVTSMLQGVTSGTDFCQ
jgi:RHS repeat-associated protein